jgi:tRNA(fMet)-specific endonuclease VapC
MVLLDTDICIYLLNQRPGFEFVLKRWDGREYGEISLSAITLAELRFGIAASRRRSLNLAKLELFLASFEAVSFDDRAAAAYGSLRARLEAQGTPIRSAGHSDCRPRARAVRDIGNE